MIKYQGKYASGSKQAVCKTVVTTSLVQIQPCPMRDKPVVGFWFHKSKVDGSIPSLANRVIMDLDYLLEDCEISKNSVYSCTDKERQKAIKKLSEDISETLEINLLNGWVAERL